MTHLNYSRVISLHLEGCSRIDCPHSSICYLKNRISQKEKHKFDPGSLEIEYFLDRGYIVYDAICDIISDYNLWLLEKYKNYNITISFNLFNDFKSHLSKYDKQLQITVYNESQLEQLEDYQKIYLIKDNQSLMFAFNHMSEPWKNIHYSLYQGFVNENRNIYVFLNLAIMKCNGTNISIDSCAENVSSYGKCLYKKTYIDINYDGTIRRCPFQKHGLFLGDSAEEIDRAFDKISQVDNCIYLDIKKGNK